MQTGHIAARSGTGWRNPDGKGAPAAQHPVVCVSWTDAASFAVWLSAKTGQSYRLPTEAEWEYAAFAGGSGEYYWRGGSENGCDDANTYDRTGRDASISWPYSDCADGFAGVAQVGSFRPNAFGLHDMTGNVWEWVEDCYAAPYPANAPVNGRAFQVGGKCDKRAVRGGSWITTTFRNRPTWRGRDPEDLRSWIFGFRIARDLKADNKPKPMKGKG